MEESTYSNAPALDDVSERQAALRRYHILDTEPEKDFDRITSLVAKVCDVPTALITLIDEERQWFKSCFGFDARETDIGVSFCVHAVHQGEMLVVEDATTDPRFKDNPIVTGPPHIRFYAGAPLTTPDGLHIGTLCIIDYEARAFDAAQREILERLADVVVNQFELRSAEAQVQQLVDQNPQPMYVYAQDDGSILQANEAAHKLYEADHLSSLTADALRAPAGKQPASDDLSLHQRADGSFVPVRPQERGVLFDGRPAILAAPQRISERPDTDTTIFFQTDLEGTVQSLSGEWEDATGFSIADTVDSPFMDFIHPLDRSETTDVFSALLSGDLDTCRHETSILTEDGAESFDLHARLVRDASGTPIGATGTLTPIIEDGDPPSSSASTAPSEEEDDTTDDVSASTAVAENGTTDAPAAHEEAAEASSPDEEPSSSEDPAPAPTPEDPEETASNDEEPSPEAASAPSATDSQDSDETSAAEAPPPSTGDGDTEPTPNSVFSADLPSFADAEPSSPSAPIDPPEESADPSPTSQNDDANANERTPPAPDAESHPEPFDIVAHLHSVIDANDQAAREANSSLRRALPDDAVPVRLDPQAIRNVVGTLIEHALTNTESGPLTVRAEADDERIGIAIEGVDSPDPFPTGDSALSSVRTVVSEMGGTLNREAKEGGLHIDLVLPRSVSPAEEKTSSILSTKASEE